MTMNAEVKQILDKVLHLSALERAVVAERLLSSLDTPDPEIDKLWAEEAEARIDAFERGEIETVSAEDVFRKYEQR